MLKSLSISSLLFLCLSQGLALPHQELIRSLPKQGSLHAKRSPMHHHTAEGRQLENILTENRESLKSDPAPEPRHDFTVPVMIAREGYPVETHTVITDDGYILEMHRIPYGKKSPVEPGVAKPVVYLQHGLLCSSADWVMGIPEKSLGFILADAGYDVWLGNYRGNTYGRNHLSLQPSKQEFWHFSWDQMGEYDIPAMINTALSTTGHDQLFYIGHSMGTTGFMVFANKHPEMLDKVILANFLAPVAYVDHMKSPISLLAPFANQVEWIAEHLGLGEFLPSNWLMDWLAGLFCDTNWLQSVCSSILFVLCGFDKAQLNETLLETIVHHTPAGASTQTIIHYAQEINSKKFSSYDWGSNSANNEHYGQDDPPEYSLGAVNVPVALYWSQNDWLAQPDDVLELISQLPMISDIWKVPFEQWNHLDYLWGIDADTLVYPRVLENMKKFETR